MRLKLATISLLILSLSYTVSSQTLGKQVYKSGFVSPVDITNAGDGSGRLFVVEQVGTIKIIDKNKNTLLTNFLDIRPRVLSGGERGLLGLAFHPDYENNGFFFVNYTNKQGNTVIERYSVSGNANIADTVTSKKLLTITQPYSNHNGGCLKFNPIDGYLYIGTGDGGSGGDPSCNAQNPMSFLGKMLRLDVNQNTNTVPYYGIPAGNPYVGNGAYKPEIWAVGLRNPWRFSFDRSNGDLWIADVGQGDVEEVDHTPYTTTGGLNYGWRVQEGTNCYNPPTEPGDNCIAGLPACGNALYVPPVFQYGHNGTTGGFSITGGFVYRGCDFPNLKGKYLCADYVSGHAWLLTPTYVSTQKSSFANNPTCFGEDENGELYCGGLNDGTIYRVIDTSVPLIAVASGTIAANQFALDTFKISSPINVTGGILNVTTKNLVVTNNVNIGSSFQINLIKPTCP